MELVQERVIKVLERMTQMTIESEDMADEFADGMEEMLSEMASNDVFGTENQLDPRGDGRIDFSMTHVEGIDS